MSTDQQRKERVRQGSRRKRDLAATPKLGFSGRGWELAVAWAEKELPEEHTALAAAACMTHGALNGGRYPTTEQAMDRLRLQGRDRASLEGGRE